LFLEHARKLRRYGAAAVIMAFDEQGQADTVERRVAICARAQRLLTERLGFPPEDLIFDPNIFAVATGIEEHNGYALAFIEAARGARRTSGGAGSRWPSASSTRSSRASTTTSSRTPRKRASRRSGRSRSSRARSWTA